MQISSNKVVVSTVYLDPVLHAAAKAYAKDRGWTLKVLIERSIRKEISGPKAST
jgi:hypothetical protein